LHRETEGNRIYYSFSASLIIIALVPSVLTGWGRGFFSQMTPIKIMYELFLELTDLIFWDGYTEQLQKENPKEFEKRFYEFLNDYYL
jgi:hypothetical protein